MSKVLQHIVAHTYKPLLVKYLSKTRVYRHNDIQLTIPPQVFHPGFFFSTQLLLQYIDKMDLNNNEFLELGCGSGLISIAAAKKGAKVTATDINTIAIEELKKNGEKNNVVMEIIESDLFAAIPIKQFDVIAINPPYYKKQPLQEKDYAWYCGERGEYFSVFFQVLKKYIHADTKIFMVLFDGADMKMINAFAAKNNFALRCVHQKKNLLEENFIFKIEKGIMNSILTYTFADEFEELHWKFREKEGRLYTDEEVLLLPKIRKAHRYSDEWETRKNSLKRLLSYLKRKSDEFNLLEIGCGNGWLSAQLAKHTKGKVIGIDVNGKDIEQAQRVFDQVYNVEFIQGRLSNELLQDEKFDFIIFAASIEYFSSLKDIISAAAKYLTLQGEIHIIDSFFYKQKEITAATKRTTEHFVDTGVEEMSSFYFHHSIDDFKKFNHQIFYNPIAWNNILITNHNPFHHIIIRNRFC